MRLFLLIAAVALFTGCAKEPAATGARVLTSVTSNNKINERLEYNGDGKLVKQDMFYFCDQPADQYTYTYSNGKIIKAEAVIRSVYSSSAAVCGGAAGMFLQQTFEYDEQQRIKKVIHENSITTYTYNSAGLVERTDLTSDSASFYSTYTYDSRNNLVEQYNSSWGTTRYEFDNKRNPYYEIKSQPYLITAFNSSPNNVVKIITSAVTSTISYQYGADGLPVKMFDPNGGTYEYRYE